jgi:hypothetical protein
LFPEDFATVRNGFVALPADHGIATELEQSIAVARPFIAILTGDL